MENSKATYADTEYSSGDSKMIKSKQHFTEENNNQVDELTKDFSEMGCIVNPVKQPSNICIETCVYESSGDEGTNGNEEADGYSDEFEEDKSEEEELKMEPASPKRSSSNLQDELAMKLTNSRSSMLSKPPATISGRSTSTSSQFVPTTRRVNMSFSNDRLREIERQNHILLNKILTARNSSKSSIPARAPRRPPPAAAAAVQRKQQQKKIDHENMILLKKIQRAKPCAAAAAPGARR